MTIDVSVVIATHDRVHLLEGALRALLRQNVPDPSSFEIVVVDNDSSDGTRDLVRSFAKTSPTPVRYCFEPQRGLSHARNRGIGEARGGILAFTDDDVLPDPDWVGGIVASMERWKAHGVGGRILPQWETPPPPWLTESRFLLEALALMDSEESRPLSLPLGRGPRVWGPNMAFRRGLFERAGTFDPRLGVAGRRLFRGEEVDLIERALRLGSTIAYDATLVVRHRIGADRMRRSYFRKLIYDRAVGHARVTPPPLSRALFGAPLGAYRTPATRLLRWTALQALARPGAFEAELSLLDSVGRLVGCWRRPRAGESETVPKGS